MTDPMSMEHILARFDRETARTRRSFLGSWTWNDVYSCWRDHAMALGAPPDPLFLPVRLHDPAHAANRDADLAWWPAEEIVAWQLDAQRSLNDWPGTNPPIHRDREPSGWSDTLENLWDVQGDPQGIAAILIIASLQATRGHHEGILAVKELAYSYLRQAEQTPYWHGNVRRSLPGMGWYANYIDFSEFKDASSLVQALAKRHALLLQKYRPVLVEYHESPDPEIVAKLEIEHREREELWARLDRERQEAEARLAARRAAAPRYGELGSISAEELSRLVWLEPSCRIARIFGVSRFDVARRCKKLGIVKPAPGFWAKVQAGHLPHPQGFAPDGARRGGA